jgi:NTP pyrophosphatase (non-canonical NTP hydrolase)
VNLTDYQHQAQATDVLASDVYLPLLGMVGEVGSLVAEYKKRERDKVGYRAFEQTVHEELGDLLWYMAAVANRTGLDLSDVAAANLRKVRETFRSKGFPEPVTRLDADAPAEEQLPSVLTVTFVEFQDLREDGVVLNKVRMVLGDQPIGDVLDDNSLDADDYRFHDVFHLAHMAVLGWSPVMRGLLGRKRRTNPDMKRVQDGGRAIAIEEGLSAFVFSVSADYDRFRTSTDIPQSVLKACRSMTAHLEVSSRGSADWALAIRAGYRMFHELTTHRGGSITADLEARTLKFTGPQSGRQAIAAR